MSKERQSDSYPRRVNTIQSISVPQHTAFKDKINQIKSIIASILPENKQKELVGHLQELNEIYQMEIQQDRVRNMKGKISECEVKNLIENDLAKEKVRTSEKVILEVRQGGRIINQVKSETQKKVKSPNKKVEDKKFMKFQPRKISKIQQAMTLANILKPYHNI